MSAELNNYKGGQVNADQDQVALGDDLLNEFSVMSKRDVEPVKLHGAVNVRKLFTRDETAFKSLSFVLYNYISPGEVNERHSHADIEKVHYVVQGEATVHCGDECRMVTAGDFFFFPVGVPHQIHNHGTKDFEYVVVAADTQKS